MEDFGVAFGAGGFDGTGGGETAMVGGVKTCYSRTMKGEKGRVMMILQAMSVQSERLVVIQE